MIAFIIWAAVGLLFVGVGIYSFFAKKPAGFWANAEQFEVSDVKGYNHTMGILWCVFGIILIALGLPLLMGQNSPYIMLSIAGVLIESIGMMIVYVLIIEKKYRKKE